MHCILSVKPMISNLTGHALISSSISSCLDTQSHHHTRMARRHLRKSLANSMNPCATAMHVAQTKLLKTYYGNTALCLSRRPQPPNSSRNLSRLCFKTNYKKSFPCLCVGCVLSLSFCARTLLKFFNLVPVGILDPTRFSIAEPQCASQAKNATNMETVVKTQTGKIL